MTPYLPIACLFILAVLFCGISFVASRLLAPHRTTAAKSAPYECGIVPTKEPAQRFPVRFYLIAMIFIVFDIEIIFLYPWATILKDSGFGVFGFVEMLEFAIVTFIAFVYLVANGALDWGPISKRRDNVDQTRTSASTVRHISDSDSEAA